MLAMLRKDVCVMGKYAAAYTAVWIVMAAVYANISDQETGFLYYAMPSLSITVALNAVSSDHECRWDRFAAMTPLRPWMLVLEKYLFTCGLLALVTVLGGLAAWASSGNWNVPRMVTCLALVLLMTASALPVVYRFGRRKGSTLLLGFWGVVAALILGAAFWDYSIIEAAFGWIDDVPPALFGVGLGAVLLTLSVLSFLLSLRFYTRRQRGWYD